MGKFRTTKIRNILFGSLPAEIETLEEELEDTTSKAKRAKITEEIEEKQERLANLGDDDD